MLDALQIFFLHIFDMSVRSQKLLSMQLSLKPSMFVITFVHDVFTEYSIHASHAVLRDLRTILTKSPWNQNWLFFLFFIFLFFLMEHKSVYCKWFIGAHHYCVKFMFLIILNQNIFSSLLQHLFSSLMMRAGQPVTHMRSTNSKPQPSNQFTTDKIKPRPTFVLVPETIYIIQIYGTHCKHSKYLTGLSRTNLN